MGTNDAPRNWLQYEINIEPRTCTRRVPTVLQSYEHLKLEIGRAGQS